MTRKRCLLSTPLFSIVPEVLASAIRKRKKQHIDLKGASKTICIFRWHYCVHRKHHAIYKRYTKIIEFNKVTEYKANRIKKQFQFYTSNEHLENEIFTLSLFCLFTLVPHCFFLSDSTKEPGIQTSTRWLLWVTSLPPSGSASFPNKVISLASIPCLSDSLVCHEVSRVSLDSVTLQGPHTQDRAQPPRPRLWAPSTCTDAQGT